jgi:serine/threonine protein kinase
MSLTRLLNALPEPLFSTYTIDKVLGVGAYAIVYQIRDKKTSEVFALKMIEIEPMRARLMLEQLDREVSFLEEFSGTEHIVELLEVTKNRTHIFLRFDLCQKSLEDMATKYGPMKEQEAFEWLRHACLGVQGLHTEGAVHRDLKPSNLLVDKEGVLRVSDFGWACWEEQQLDGTCGTPQYACPELRMKQGSKVLHTTKVDIYGLGACFQHLVLGRVPKGPGDLPKGLSAASQELLAEMMDPNPTARPTIDDLLQRPELAGSTLVEQMWNTWQSLFDIPVLGVKTTKQKNVESEISCGLGQLR